jgi:hypothetical protein
MFTGAARVASAVAGAPPPVDCAMAGAARNATPSSRAEAVVNERMIMLFLSLMS